MLRSVIRALLPQPIRRPLADKVYRLVTFVRRVRYWLSVFVRTLFFHLQRRAIANQAYQLADIEKNKLHLLQRWQSQLLLIIIRGYERIFCKYYQKFALSLRPETDLNKRNGLVFIISTLGPGGAERQTVLTLTQFKLQKLYDLSLFTFFLQTATQRFYLETIEKAEIEVKEIDRGEQENSNTAIQFAMNTVQKLPPEMRQDTLSCVRSIGFCHPKIVHLWLDEVNIKGGFAAVALGVPKIILSTRSLPPCHFVFYQPYMREGYRWLAARPGVIILNNSKAGAHAYEQWLGLPTGHIKVINNGFDFDRLPIKHYQNNRLAYKARYGIPAQALVVGTVIRFSEEKRPKLWIEIAAYVRNLIPHIHFLMVGDGPLYSEIAARTKQADLAGALHLVGYEKESLAAIAAMDLFLLTSRAEGLPNVLIEAQAMGVPVITTNAGGAAETVEHGVTGWVLESDTVEYVGNIIVSLLNKPAWRAQASLAAMEFVRHRFGLQRMMEETRAVYEA